MEGESGVTRCRIDELHSSVIQGDQMEVETGVTRSIIGELHSPDLIKLKVIVGVFEVSIMNFNIWISNEIK